MSAAPPPVIAAPLPESAAPPPEISEKNPLTGSDCGGPGTDPEGSGG